MPNRGIFLLSVLAALLLAGCSPTRVALPVGAAMVLAEVPRSEIITEDDHYGLRTTRDGRQELRIEHRDGSARVKKPVAVTTIMIQPLSRHTSEVLIRSDSTGWLWTWRDRGREDSIASDLRRWADTQAELRRQESGEAPEP
ncbi:MAG: hypothetical protein EA402_08020 [Planctomycetota bacterium]|nr:MAG: hypothetical protein EA402_08020 [Planctomycetota bacterium]